MNILFDLIVFGCIYGMAALFAFTVVVTVCAISALVKLVKGLFQ